MAIVNFGSINIDKVYRVSHFPAAGETLLVDGYSVGLGGKGANQSIAAARAGAAVRHIGAIGTDGLWTKQRLTDEGIDTDGIAVLDDEATGHAVIEVDPSAENKILVLSGANAALTQDQIDKAVGAMHADDWLLFQNETNLTEAIAAAGKAKGVRIAYSAAPFIADKVTPLLDMVDMVCVNHLEAATLAQGYGGDMDAIPVSRLLVTYGARGAEYREDGHVEFVPSFKVDAVDTTGAGDTFLGSFLAAISKDAPGQHALLQASAAAALQVSRHGAADAIPTADDVYKFLLNRA